MVVACWMQHTHAASVPGLRLLQVVLELALRYSSYAVFTSIYLKCLITILINILGSSGAAHTCMPRSFLHTLAGSYNDASTCLLPLTTDHH